MIITIGKIMITNGLDINFDNCLFSSVFVHLLWLKRSKIWAELLTASGDDDDDDDDDDDNDDDDDDDDNDNDCENANHHFDYDWL